MLTITHLTGFSAPGKQPADSLSGVAALVFAAVGSLTTLSGSAGLAFNAPANLAAGAAFGSTVGMSLGSAGNLAVSAALGGTAGATLAASGQVSGLGGTAALALAAQANLRISEPLAGPSALTFAPAADLRISEPLAVASALALAAAADLRISASLSGTASVALGSTGNLFHSETTDWVQRVVANSGTVSAATREAVNDFVGACKTAGIWTKFKRVNLFAGDQLAACLVPLVNTLGNATDTNSNFVAGNFAEATGLDGDGSTKYLSTGLAPTSLAYDSFHLAVYVCNQGTAEAATEIGSVGFLSGGGGELRLQTNFDNGATTYRFRAFAGDSAVGTNAAFSIFSTTVPAGLCMVSRTASNLMKLADNSGVIETNSSSYTGEPLMPGQGVAVFAANLNGTITEFSSKVLGGYSIGTGLTAAEMADYATAMQAFQTALGREI